MPTVYAEFRRRAVARARFVPPVGQVAADHLQVRLNPLSAPRRTRALAAPCDQLNQTESRYPGTDLVLLYSVLQLRGIA